MRGAEAKSVASISRYQAEKAFSELGVEGMVRGRAEQFSGLSWPWALVLSEGGLWLL